MSEIDTHTIDPSAASPGAILKRCREYHEITLEEAEEATKIGANYLQALEEDQIGQFASAAYLKGFLRIYTTYLGLNPDDMIRLYDKPAASGTKQVDPKSCPAGSAPPVRSKIPLQKLLMPAVLLAVIILVAAIVNRPTSTPLRQNQPPPAAAPLAASVIQPVLSSAKPPLPLPSKKTEETPVNPQQPASLPVMQHKAPSLPPENTKGFIARMKVTQAGTLTVTIDGSTSQDYDLAVGDSIEWKADRSITLELSNSGGVEVELNGKPLKAFGQPGKQAVVVLDADGVRQ